MKGGRRLLVAAAGASVVVLGAIAGSADAAATTLTVATAGSGTGTVTGPGIACPGDCSQSYASGKAVTLRAKAGAASKFTGWAGACADGGRCSLTMDSDQSVTATFEARRRLSVSVGGSGSGRVTGPGIDCPGDCSQLYSDGAAVTLHRKASAGSRFTGWSGACAGTGSCTVTMDAAKSVRATFKVQRTLSVSISGSGSGRVKGPRINCPGDCSGAYANGTRVKLRATPAAGSTFTGWGGACSGTGACRLKMDGDKSVTATFRARRTLTVSTTGPGFGHVTGPGIDCPVDCSQSYARGTAVTLTTPHGRNTRFAGWSGACSGRGTCVLTMSANRSVAAKFKFKKPDTEITKAKIRAKKHKARFEFEGKGKVKGFQCQLKRKHHKAKSFDKCQSPKRYKHLKPGKYTFKVRAKGPGGHDPTAAKKKFKIKR